MTPSSSHETCLPCCFHLMLIYAYYISLCLCLYKLKYYYLRTVDKVAHGGKPGVAINMPLLQGIAIARTPKKRRTSLRHSWLQTDRLDGKNHFGRRKQYVMRGSTLIWWKIDHMRRRRENIIVYSSKKMSLSLLLSSLVIKR